MPAGILMYRYFLQCIDARLFCAWTDTPLSGLHDGGTADGSTSSVQSKRLQVLITWRENQQLEEELKEKPVSFGTTTATELCIKDVKVQGDEHLGYSYILPCSSHVYHC